jgi:hypothetical protein
MPKVYPLETVERGLTFLATLGSTTLAADAMKEAGDPVPRKTLELWKRTTHAARYNEIASDHAPKIRQRMAAEAESVVDRLAALEHKAAERLESQLGDLEGKDLAGALRNISTSKGINLQHAAAMRDRPSLIVEHKHSVEDLDRLIQAIDQTEPPHIDSEAELVEDAACGQLPAGSDRSQRAYESAAQ